MCTVTFVASGRTIFLTSNRDEKCTRSKAFRPKMQPLQSGQRLLFPKDPDAGGSWIGLKNTGDAAVLLNGAFVVHQPKAHYRRSRGLVLVEIIASLQPVAHFNRMNLYDVEPFTVILFVKSRLYECRWDGEEKFMQELNAAGTYIWSSATLFDTETKLKREEWFGNFLRQHPVPSHAQVLDFHRNGGSGDWSIDIRINRPGKVKTVSITSIVLSPSEQSLHYLDLENGTTATTFFEHKKAAVKKEMQHAG